MGVAPTLPSKLCVPHPLKWEMFRKNVNMVLQLDLNGTNNGFIPTPSTKILGKTLISGKIYLPTYNNSVQNHHLWPKYSEK